MLNISALQEESIPTLNSILDAPGDTSAGREMDEIKSGDRGALGIRTIQASLWPGPPLSRYFILGGFTLTYSWVDI